MGDTKRTEGTKTVTVMYDDVDASIARWERKGWQPISITVFEEPDQVNLSRTIAYSTIVLARMGKPK